VPVRDSILAAITLAILTAINCLGVRSGTNTQNALMLLKLAAIVVLILAGASVVSPSHLSTRHVADGPSLLLRFGAAMTPVMFAYGGWQTASFVSGELRRPRRDLVIGLVAGVFGVIAVYVAVNVVCVGVLGADQLANVSTPASAVMRIAFGAAGARFIALGIAVSTLGFLSQSMLTAPRVYYAMAKDGVFFDAVGHVSERTRVPVVAIILQGVVAIVITLSGTYEQILSYVVSVDFVFFGLTGAAVFVFRHRHGPGQFRTPGHPLTTAIFTLACWAVVVATIVQAPRDSVIGYGILAAGLAAYLFWRKPETRNQKPES